MTEPTEPETVGLGQATEAVIALVGEVRRLRGEIKRKTRVGYWIAVAVSAVAVIAAAWGGVNQVRVDGAIHDIRANQTADAAERVQLRRGQEASCVAFARLGDPRLLSPTSGPIARTIVGDFGAAADIIGCEPKPLPPATPSATATVTPGVPGD